MNVVKHITTVALGVTNGAAIAGMGYTISDWQGWAWVLGLAVLLVIRDGAMMRECDQ